MKERIWLHVDLLRRVEDAAAAHGEPVEVFANRLFARGAMRLLADLLSPLLNEPSPSASRPRLTTGAGSSDFAPTSSPTAMVAASATEPESADGSAQ